MTETVLRILSLCLALAGTETLHGIARAAWLVPRIGKRRALQVSIVTGSLLAFVVCRLLVPPMGITATGGLLALGALLALFMAAFDVMLARLLLKRPWRKVCDDFNPATGNYLLVGLALLVVIPWLATHSGI